jgi:imidazolonepropionase-like amidohydrolase
MRRLNALATASALALIIAVGSTFPANAQVTAFDGARVIVGDGSPPIENATLVVDGAKIVRIGRGAGVSVPAGATHVNVAGKTIMPTIIDTHVHLTATREAVTRDMKRRAYYGVSAVQSMGTDEGEAVLQMRNETQPGMGRVFTAWHGITRPEPGRTMAPVWINNPMEARKAVQDLAAKDVDIIKVWVDDRNGMFPKVTPDQYAALIDEAHKNGLRVTAHIFTLEDAKGLLRANLDAFAHSVRDKDVDDEFMTLVRQHPNLVVNPNLPGRGVKTDVTWLRASLPADEYAKVEEENVDNARAQTAHGIQARNLAKLTAAGVKIVVGTDGNTPWAPHVEMEDMALAGMTPMQVIVAGTKNAAEFLRMTDAGTLEPGKSADLLILDANPLDDIKNTRKISAVYLRGAMVDRSKLP